ncbi:MAG: hypothetical protein MUE30_07385, partial [Spirosomaceae bacterium]|nr:hypothetical protein [Spirosomataceae bacterium]
FDSWKEVLQKHWPNAPKTNHLYADYDIEQIVSGVFSAKRPLLVLLDAEGKFLASSSPFDAEKIKAWLK